MTGVQTCALPIFKELIRVVLTGTALVLLPISLYFDECHFGYCLVANVWGTLLWAILQWFSLRSRILIFLLSIALTVVVQQFAFWLWRGELGSVGWAVTQFLALQYIGFAVLQSISDDRAANALRVTK